MYIYIYALHRTNSAFLLSKWEINKIFIFFFLICFHICHISDGIPTENKLDDHGLTLTLKPEIIHAIHQDADVKKTDPFGVKNVPVLEKRLDVANKLSLEKHLHELLNNKAHKPNPNARDDIAIVKAVPGDRSSLRTSEMSVIKEEQDEHASAIEIQAKKKIKKMKRKNKRKQIKIARKQRKQFRKKMKLRLRKKDKQIKPRQGNKRKQLRLLNRKKGKKNKRKRFMWLLRKHLKEVLRKKSEKPVAPVKAEGKPSDKPQKQLRSKAKQTDRKNRFRKYLRMLKLMIRQKKKGMGKPKNMKKKPRMLNIAKKTSKTSGKPFLTRKHLRQLLKTALKKSGLKRRQLMWPKRKIMRNKVMRANQKPRKGSNKRQLRLLKRKGKFRQGKRKMSRQLRKQRPGKLNKRNRKLNRLKNRKKNRKRVRCGIRCQLNKLKANKVGDEKMPESNLETVSVVKDTRKTDKKLTIVQNA